MDQLSAKAFITPQEYIKIQLKKQQLQKRLNQKSGVSNSKEKNSKELVSDGFQRQKRKNPFAKEFEHHQQQQQIPERKRTRSGDEFDSIEDTIFELIHSTKSKITPNLEQPINSLMTKHGDEVMGVLSNIHEKDENNEESLRKQEPKVISVLPIDWSIKSKIRIICPTMIVPSTLKSNVEVSGQTSFVRCLDIKNTSSGLDISDGTRFHEHLMFWQYPHLPWLNLINRNINSNNQYKMPEREADSLFNDWKESFRNLFQLLRARQCPYFYVLASQYNILFRAAGIGGMVEMHAFVSPTTKGFRQMLTDEDIEFTQPLKVASNNNKSITSNTITNEDDCEKQDLQQEQPEMDEETFLETLGIDKSQIRFKDDIKTKQKDLEDDNGELSTILVDGVDCQALVGFLIDAKNTIPKIGKLAGIPPTLLSPVGFLGGSLRRQKMRCSKLKIDSVENYSIELSGAILPHTIHSLTTLLSEMKDSYNMTLTNFTNTVSFSKSSRKLMENLDSSQAFADHVFGRENLSDCGMNNELLESMCRVESDAIAILEKVQYNREKGGYMF